MPGWIRRWRRLQPLAVDDGPALVRYLAGLCREAGLHRLPTFLVDPRQRSIDGAAFGHIGQYAVVLSAGLVATFSTDRPTFRAVALHGLAHLKNRDVDLASLARATWLAFILVAVAPFAFYPLLLAGGPFPATTALPDVAWRLAAATLLVYLLHNAVLRARELYADARVAGSAEAGAALRPVLATLQPPRLDRFWARWWDALGHRPDSAARRRVLDNPGSLLDAGIGEAFAAGLVAGLALTTVDAFLSSLLPGDLGEQGVVAALIVAPLAAGVILPNIWRAAYARVRQGHHPHGIGRAGAALGLGYVLGLHAAPGGQAIVLPQPGGLSLPEALLCDLASTAMLAASLALLFRALAGTATAWLRASRSNSVSGRTMGVALVVGSGLLTVWLHWFTVSVYAVRWVLPAARLFPDNVLTELAANASVALLDPLTLGMLGALLAFRLAASVSRLVRS